MYPSPSLSLSLSLSRSLYFLFVLSLSVDNYIFTFYFTKYQSILFLLLPYVLVFFITILSTLFLSLHQSSHIFLSLSLFSLSLSPLSLFIYIYVDACIWVYLSLDINQVTLLMSPLFLHPLIVLFISADILAIHISFFFFLSYLWSISLPHFFKYDNWLNSTISCFLTLMHSLCLTSLSFSRSIHISILLNLKQIDSLFPLFCLFLLHSLTFYVKLILIFLLPSFLSRSPSFSLSLSLSLFLSLSLSIIV